MEIETLGSGGAIPVPRPGCHCPICDDARAKGVPFARTGPSTFIHGADILFDTPEESRVQLNRSGIDRVAACFYSHWHPDHVMGRRVFEALNWDLREWPWRPRVTEVYLPEQVAVDFRTRLASAEHLEYLQQLGVVRIREVRDGDSVTVGEVTVTPFRLAEEYVYAFLVEQGETRVLIAPDELHGWSPPAWLGDLDLAIMPMGLCEHDPFTGARRMAEDHPFLREEARFSETLDMVRALRAREVVLTHIEEMDGLGHDQLAVLADRLRAEGLPITFAWDTMRINAG